MNPRGPFWRPGAGPTYLKSKGAFPNVFARTSAQNLEVPTVVAAGTARVSAQNVEAAVTEDVRNARVSAQTLEIVEKWFMDTKEGKVTPPIFQPTDLPLWPIARRKPTYPVTPSAPLSFTTQGTFIG